MVSVVVLFIAAFSLDLCSQCCTAHECGHFKTQPKCLDGTFDTSVAHCRWDGATSTCVIETCSDRGQSTCESPSDPSCRWDGAACVEANSCSAWSGHTDCSGKRYAKPCVVEGDECRSLKCEDFAPAEEASDCEQGGYGITCVWNSGTKGCTPATSCSDWNNPQNIDRCNQKHYGESDDFCYNYGGVCQKFTCPIFSENDCEDMGCKWSSGSCIEATSCGDWSGTTEDKCEAHGYGYADCVWESNTCRSALCSDYSSGQTTCENNGHVLYCMSDNGACVGGISECEATSGETNCMSLGFCTYLEGSCPAVGDAASRVFIPSGVIILAMLLSLVFW